MSKYDAILPFYRNKFLAIIQHEILPILERAERDGFWGKGESRKVKAALNKTDRRETASAVAGAKIAYVERRYACIDVEHGRFEHAPKYLPHARTMTGLGRDANEFLAWCEAFAPIAELVERLDKARPLPAYVFAEVSPTVFANVREAMGIDFSSVRQPDIVWHKVEYAGVDGKPRVMHVAEILWPEGTRHNVSRFSFGSKAGNDQCQACGHAIRTRNWVPLVADTVDGPVSLWVGRDCARTFFGAAVTGEAEFKKPESVVGKLDAMTEAKP